MTNKQFEITVAILVTVPNNGACGMTAQEWASQIATDFAGHSKYKSIGADQVLEINIKEVENA